MTQEELQWRAGCAMRIATESLSEGGVAHSAITAQRLPEEEP